MTEHSPTLSEDQGSIPSTAQTNKQKVFALQFYMVSTHLEA